MNVDKEENVVCYVNGTLFIVFIIFNILQKNKWQKVLFYRCKKCNVCLKFEIFWIVLNENHTDIKANMLYETIPGY